MTMIDNDRLDRVLGGKKVVFTGTPAQDGALEACSARAATKSKLKFWTWGRTSKGGCVKNFIDDVIRNPPQVVDG